MPTPNVSLVDLVVNINKSGVTVSNVNSALKAAAEGPLDGILGYTEAAARLARTSTAAPCPRGRCRNTYVIDNMVKVLSWYDNETGYSTRMVDLAAMIGGMQQMDCRR